MSKSEDNTNELESYGVWVKNAAESEQPQTNEQSEDIEEVSDLDLDLPDFDDTDFSDMFKDDSQFSTDEKENDFGNDSDTTLSTDELANITDLGDVAIENVDAPVEKSTATEDIATEQDDPFSLPEDIEDIIEESSETAEPIFDSQPEKKDEDLEDVINTFDTDNIEESITNNEITIDTNDSKIPDEKDEGEEEISIDDFMTEGFSDESVASGNNGYEPGKEEIKETISSGETEDISLDDFLGEETVNVISDNDKNDETAEEKPIDMDITFDDSLDDVETEDNLSLEDTIEENEEPDIETELEETPESDVFENVPVADEPIADAPVSDESVSLNTEEIDLSDFGIDADAEETPIIQDVETQKNKEKVVDYDLFIGNEDTSSAPVVNEVKTEDKKETKENQDDVEDLEELPQTSTMVDNTLLQQIVADLSSLKDEINTLKTNIAEIKNNEAGKAVEQKEEIKEEEPFISEDESDISKTESNEPAASDELDDIDLNTDNIVIPQDNDEGGFFGSDDTDETIALSGDELNNIMINADFGNTEDDQNAAENQNDEVSDEIPVEKNSTSEVIPETKDAEEEQVNDNTVEESLESNDFAEESNIVPNTEEELQFEYSDEKLEEPNLDDLTIDEVTDEDKTEVSDEITIPSEDSILVESTSSDFMDSVKDTTEEMAEIAPEESVSEIEEIEEPVIDEIEEPVVEEPVIDEIEEPVVEEPVIDKTEETVVEEPVIDEYEEPTVEESIIEEPVIDEIEEPVAEEPANDENEEPTIEEPQAERTETLEENGDLEKEIDEVPTVDDLLSTPVKDEGEATDEEKTDDFTFDDVDFLNIDKAEESEEATESTPEVQVQEEMNAEPVPEEKLDNNEQTADEASVDDIKLPDFEDEVIEEQDEPTIDETAVSADETYEEVDNLDNNLSTSNLDYLTKKENKKDDTNDNNDLKQEIKSVLLYMDQLLENLPEDKIYEFAKSDEFTTYKKLFKDLGLS